MLLILLIASGCGSGDLQSGYGRRRVPYAKGLNSTSALAEMFEQSGYRVSSWGRLSPRLERAQTIVWVPDSFQLPESDETAYLEQWLQNEGNRSLIFVDRDYDGVQEYWKMIEQRTQGAEYLEARRRRAVAQSTFDLERSFHTPKRDCAWFSIERHDPPTLLTCNMGTWAPLFSDLQLPVGGTLTFGNGTRIQHEILLGVDDQPWLVRLTSSEWNGGQILVCLNGGATLNLPLVHHNRRVLAQKLIDDLQATSDKDRVIFLETGRFGAEISAKDPVAFHGLDAFGIWPISPLLMHVTVVGLIYCVMVFPIFGKPKDLVDAEPSDFIRHVTAMGELLAASNERESALQRIQAYRDLMSANDSRDRTGGNVSPSSSGSSGNPFAIPVSDPNSDSLSTS